MQGTASFMRGHPVLTCDDLWLKCFILTGKRKCTIKFEEKKKPLYNSWKHVYNKISYKTFT